MTICATRFWSRLAAASSGRVINAAPSNGQSFLVDAGQGGAAPAGSLPVDACGHRAHDSLSLCRFVVFGIPTLLDGWYASNKQWLYTPAWRR